MGDASVTELDGIGLSRMVQEVELVIHHSDTAEPVRHERLALRSSDDAVTQLDVHLIRDDAIHVAPKSIFLNAPQEPVATRKVELTSDRPFRIVGLDGPEWISMSDALDQPSTLHTLNLRFDLSDVDDVFVSESLAIHSDHPDQPIVHLRFIARVPKMAKR